MPTLFWLALLLGYLTGVAAAVLLLPAPLIAPLYGPLALATVVVLAGFGLLLQLRRVRGRGTPTSRPPRHGPSPGDRRAGAAGEPEPQAPPAEDGPPAGDHDPDDRWPLMVRLEAPGVIGPAELRQILYEGRVDARLRPVANPAAPQAVLYLALPCLRAVDDRELEAGRYRTTAARSGLLGLIDRLLLLRCAEMLRAGRAEGREMLVLCGIAAASLSDPAFLGEVEQQLSDDSKLADALVLALDHAVRDSASATALARLRRRGMRFCLRRVGPSPSDAVELRRSGFEFVLLEAGRFALDAESASDAPTQVELQRVFRGAGPTLLVGRSGAVELSGPRAGRAEGGSFELARPSAA
jgi:EAL domain-containing protein (putative c-di-GMP-specific phosphodiesterase class I)